MSVKSAEVMFALADTSSFTPAQESKAFKRLLAVV
jgi:hypothetical protein